MHDDVSRPVRSAYSERVLPGPLGWLLTVAAGGVMAAVFYPVSTTLAVVAGVATFAAAVVFALRTSPLVLVTDDELRVGDAHIPLALLTAPRPLDREQTRHETGQGYDPRAHVVLRAWAGTAVRVEVDDPLDPTPYWLISTRRPAQLAAAIGSAGR
ncbi:DUF3093 domain-containing protein [Cellulomonas timonensis]|uniref:DUF3093 domain-containing protein n=1 Tax=Cellulomonas timonensis TaxID=1689271 RepID=UPI000831411C|nr:DUF3093 domain-containing protein [Cellulomonas timonensis]